MNEILFNKVKKYTTPQLLAKVEKATGEEKDIMIQVLKDRNQDVSKWLPTETASAVESEMSPEEKIEELRQSIDDHLDALVQANNSVEYSKIVIALGGDEDSDIVELLQNASVDSLNAAAAVMKGGEVIPATKPGKVKKEKPAKEPKVKTPKPPKEPKVKKEKTPKPEKVAKTAPTDDSKSAEILALLKAGTLSKYAIAKQLNTYYSVVDYVAKRYLATKIAETPATDVPDTAAPETAE